jgi:hypothetical protein
MTGCLISACATRREAQERTGNRGKRQIRPVYVPRRFYPSLALEVKESALPTVIPLSTGQLPPAHSVALHSHKRLVKIVRCSALQIWTHGLAVTPNHGHRGNAGDCASRRTNTATHKYFGEQGDKINADDDSEARIAALLLLLLRLRLPSNAISPASIFATSFVAAQRPA